MDNTNINPAEQNAVEKKKDLKTNKKIVLDEEPVVFEIPSIDDDESDIGGGSVTLGSEPTNTPVQEVPSNEPQVQSGNITF